MSSERIGSEPRPLLLDSVEDRLLGVVLRAAGLGLMVLAAAGWLALATWSAQDPSLTHATSGLTRNWLGPLGAIVSDLLLQTLGFVAVLVFLGLAMAGLELLQHRRIAGLRLRMGLFPLAVLALAGAFGALPSPSSSPLNHGLGGIIGDIVFGAVSGVLAIVNPARAGAVTGLFLFAGGMCLLSSGLGLTQREWSLIWQPGPALPGSRPAGRLRALVCRLWARPSRQFRPTAATGAASTRAMAGGVPPHPSVRPHAAAMTRPAVVAREPGPHFEPPLREHDDSQEPVRSPPRVWSRLSGAVPSDAVPPEAEPPEGPAEPAFDHSTDLASRAMAERFAPAREHAAPRPRSASELIGGLISFRPSTEPMWRRPSLNLLKRPAAARPGPEFTQPVLRGSARLLEDVLNDFGIKGQVKDIRPGPVVTLFELEPARGIKSSRIIALADDIARSMSAASARVAAVPGRNVIGIELPNVRRETVHLRELLEAEAWRATDAQLPVALGKGIGGEPVIADLARMPHLLVAGTTGSGKSVGVNAMILSLLLRLSPADCRFLMIDPKMLELSVYNGIPHLLAPVITDPHRAAAALAWAVSEMEERNKRMAHLGVRNIELFNNRVRNARRRGELIGRTVQTGFDPATGQPVYARESCAAEPMPYIVIVVDEFADLMVVAGKEVEGAVQRLAQMARAAGIHLVMATQRPSVDVVTGTIKANFPTRIAFKVASKVDSRTILNEQGAEQLLGAGDMLFSAGSGLVTRVHGPFVSDEEVECVAAELRAAGEPSYVPALMRDPDDEAPAGPAGADAAADDADDLFDRAVAIVHRDQKASTSYLQRRLSIGYNRAADLIERMEHEGLVSAADAVGRRRVLGSE
jgi:S-DNA-T family DNA segregation ATPase FtsK/SpoIIIE